MIRNIEHVIVGGDKNLLCHWPRQGGIWNWGEELLVAYIESPCSYKNIHETGHGQDGIWKNGYIRLRRSYNGGQSWEAAGKVFDNSLSVEEQRRILKLESYLNIGDSYEKYIQYCDIKNNILRENINPESPDAIILMGRSWCGEKVPLCDGEFTYKNIPFAFRSADRGHNWEKAPTIIHPNHTSTLVELANNYFVEDKRIYSWFVGYGGVEGERTKDINNRIYSAQLYASDTNGETFDYYNEIYCDHTGTHATSYPHIIRLKSGRWLCFLSQWCADVAARNRWTVIVHSDDKGLNWSKPRTIQSWCVSPFPLKLKDGRLVVISMRRNPDPTGLTIIISEDEGKTWSNPEFINTDTINAGSIGVVDGGYPVAVQLDDGRIFSAYYWQKNDQDIPWYGGRKYICGTFFEI